VLCWGHTVFNWKCNANSLQTGKKILKNKQLRFCWTGCIWSTLFTMDKKNTQLSETALHHIINITTNWLHQLWQAWSSVAQVYQMDEYYVQCPTLTTKHNSQHNTAAARWMYRRGLISMDVKLRHVMTSELNELRYRKEHSTSVVPSWCTVSHLSGENLLMANQPFSLNQATIVAFSHFTSFSSVNRQPVCECTCKRKISHHSHNYTT